MKKLTTALLAIALSGGLTLGTAFAADKDKEKGDLSASDKEFLEMAEQINLAEIKGGEMAKMKGASAEVKDFGEKLMKDHQSVSSDLQSLAKSKNVTLPTEPNAKQKAEAESLNKLEGEKFDTAFNAAQAMGHKKAIALYKKAAKSSDAEIKAFAEKTLPALQEHQKMAGGKGGDHKMDTKPASKADHTEKKAGEKKPAGTEE